ncbi:MAG: peroxiredoxin [Solirubrobacteraceae bacterium]
MAPSPAIGEPAPDFTLDGTAGTFTLAEHRGERVVLLFYPGDNTAVCTRQFCSYRDAGEDMSGLGAVVVGISAQGVESHSAFSAKHGLNVPLLADEGGKVARAYGAHSSLSGTKRAVVIVDEDGVVRYRHDHRIGLDYLTASQIADALATLPARSGG